MGNPNTGITLDMGHSLQSQENPAKKLDHAKYRQLMAEENYNELMRLINKEIYRL